MPCYHPWRTDKGNVVSCGQCRGCRASHAREWAMRCMHEASMHEDNIFLTVTYDRDNEPPNRSLDRAAFPLFMKRLRKEIGKVRYYHVGQYGSRFNRPHYHALLFGWSPSDKALLTVREGFPVFTSELLRATWPAGLSEFGSVTPQSAAYCTGYVKTRMTGSWAKAKYGVRVPEYCTMSRNPGIGAGWIDKYRDEVFPFDAVRLSGSNVKPPRYYDNRVAAVDPLLIEGVKYSRCVHRRKENLVAAEMIAEAKDSLYSMGGTL